jgi:hypothetical protein
MNAVLSVRQCKTNSACCGSPKSSGQHQSATTYNSWEEIGIFMWSGRMLTVSLQVYVNVHLTTQRHIQLQLVEVYSGCACCRVATRMGNQDKAGFQTLPYQITMRGTHSTGRLIPKFFFLGRIPSWCNRGNLRQQSITFSK